MIVAIDVSNWFHQLWHARRGDQVSAEFARRLKAIREHWKPDSLVCAFDDRRSFRKDLDPEYKAHRPPAPPGLHEELEDLPKLIVQGRLGTLASAEGFEADDVLATIAAYAKSIGDKCVLVTSDKDARQCLAEGHISICREFKIHYGAIEPRWLTAAMHVEEHGVRPEQWPDWLALVGDPGDNVTGAVGIGPKTATAILQQVGTLDAALADPWKVQCNDKRRSALFAFRERAPLVRKLVTCRTDVPGVLEAL